MSATWGLVREPDLLPYSWSGGLAKGYRWWLLAGSRPVAYAHTLLDPTAAPETHLLLECEVRPSERGRGLARIFLRVLEGATGEHLWTDGGFTPAGLRAFSHLPLVASAVRESCFREQSFVASWDSRELR